MNKLIIFDYDGVIVDSFSKVHETYMETCEILGKECPKEISEFKEIYGESSKECYTKLGFNEKEILKGREFYKEIIQKRSPSAFEGIQKTLEELEKSYILVIISSTSKEAVEKNIEKLGLKKYFTEILGRTKENYFQKYKAMKSAITKYSTPENTISIGDRKIDYMESQLAGIKNILLVDYGWGYDPTKISGHRQNIKINSPKEIIKAIKSFA